MATEPGNAIVGFVATAGLLLLVAITLLGMALTWYVQAVLTDSASEGARAGALDGAGVAVAEARTAELITTTLPQRYAQDIHAVIRDGQMNVQVNAPSPLSGLIGTRMIEVNAHATME
ncbi:MAG: hypothetical protein Q4E03_05645 [Trueperella sp.]|nr:hypothetical protein [Trueperella sp.]